MGAPRAPKPSAGARRRGLEHPELLLLLYFTRSSGHYAPLLLAPAEGLGSLSAVLGAFAPSSIEVGAKPNMLNLVSK